MAENSERAMPSMPQMSRSTNISVAAPRNHDRAHYQHTTSYNTQLHQRQQHPNMKMPGPSHQVPLMKRKAAAPTIQEVKMSRSGSSLKEIYSLMLSATSMMENHLKNVDFDKSRAQLEEELQLYRSVVTPEDLKCGVTFAECLRRVQLLEQNLEGYRAREKIIQEQANDFRLQLA